MPGESLELHVRFAGTLLGVTRVRPDEQFLIGTAPDVDLPIALGTTTRFPLVDTGLAVRIPIGVEPTVHGDTTVLAIGLVTIAITRVPHERPIVVPRPRATLRFVPYAIATAVLHVAVVVLAMVTIDIVEPISIPVVHAKPPRHVIATKLPEPRPKPKPKHRRDAAAQSQSQPQPSTETPTTEQGAREAARHAGVLGSASLDDLWMVMGSKNLAQELADLGPVYDELAANAQNFGNSAGNFDPAKDPAFDSVKTGRYATGGPNAKMGQNYRLPARGMFREVERPPIMGLTCDDGACTTVGTLDRVTVRDYVERRYVDMVKCFERHGRKTARIELTLRFEIRDDGTPREVHSEEPSGFGKCLVRIVERVKFPSDRPTQVRYPVAFWRT